MYNLEPSADAEYGRTRGVEAYFLLLNEKPALRDKTVQEIADRALQLAVLADSRPDIMPQRAARFTARAVSDQTLNFPTGGTNQTEVS